MISAAPHARAPTVSIGLPVYNGQRFLEQALASILQQTFADFEIIICDNASTDRTAAICADFVSADPRVIYHRNPTNLGASPNFNKTFNLSRGEFFKWAADDDLIEPTYLERCLQPLLDDQEIVVANSQILVTDGGGYDFARTPFDLESKDPVRRFASIVLSGHWTHDVFGVFRSAVLRRTGLHRSYYGTDKVIMAEVALYGRLARIPEPLFINRDHPERSLRACNLIERRGYIDTATADRRVIVNVNLFRDFWSIIGEHVSDPAARRRYYGVMARWWFANWHLGRLGLEVACAAVPALAPALHELRARYHRGRLGAERAGGATNPPAGRYVAALSDQRNPHEPSAS